MTRVFFDAGRKAMARIDQHFAILTDLANANSTSAEELLGRVCHKAALQAENMPLSLEEAISLVAGRL